MKNSFVLYTDYQEQLELLTLEQRGLLFTAIMAYVSGRDLPQMDGMTSMCFAFIRQGLDRDREKYEKVCEVRRQAGRSGGLAKASNRKQMLANASKAKQTLANLADNDNDSDSDNDNDNDISIGAKSKRFAPPTKQEVAEYIREKGYTVYADRFVDFYESKGWMIGKNKMKDWKAAVRTWNKGNKGKTSKVSKFASYPQRDYDYSALEKALLGAQ